MCNTSNLGMANKKEMECFTLQSLSNEPTRYTLTTRPLTSLFPLLRYCFADLPGDPLLRSLQHSDCIQQAGAELPQTPARCRRFLGVLLVLDSAPSTGLEQLRHWGSRDKLLCVLDGSDGPVPCLHHLPVHVLPGDTHSGDGVLLQPATAGSQTGREALECN